jgi:PEP-CTERM motif
VYVQDLTGNAPANVTTDFQIPEDLISDIPGVPYFPVIGLYANGSGGTVIDVAMDPTTARNFQAEGATFDQAFPSIAQLFRGHDGFSIATPGGSVELSMPSAGPMAVPEPASIWLLGAALLAAAYARARVKVKRLT